MKARETIDAIGLVALVGAPTIAVATGILQAAAAGFDLLVLATSQARQSSGLALVTTPGAED